MTLHYLPILTTIVAAVFAVRLFRHYSAKPGSWHILWWGIGVLTYGLGTLLESTITLFGWSEAAFRLWYVAGALLGGAPLAQGTVYLIFRKRTAHYMSAALIAVFLFGAVAAFMTPLNLSLVNPNLPQGKVIVWSWVRLISPFVNLYAVIFLIGGAIVSAMHFRKMRAMRNRFIGNVLIALGAILPGIGGAFSRAGHTEVLYVGELIGLIMIWLGYVRCTTAPRPMAHPLKLDPVGSTNE